MGTANRYERLLWDLFWVFFCCLLAATVEPEWLTIAIGFCGGITLHAALQDFYAARAEIESNDVEHY